MLREEGEGEVEEGEKVLYLAVVEVQVEQGGEEERPMELLHP